jgi:hypothetical protein
MALLALLLWIACQPSRKSFDQICKIVHGKTAADVEALLGPPNDRREVLSGTERWVWWNYTFLDGESYPPEVRGTVVHLEITFENPSRLVNVEIPHASWRVLDPLGVSYMIPLKEL